MNWVKSLFHEACKRWEKERGELQLRLAEMEERNGHGTMIYQTCGLKIAWIDFNLALLGRWR